MPGLNPGYLLKSFLLYTAFNGSNNDKRWFKIQRLLHSCETLELSNFQHSIVLSINLFTLLTSPFLPDSILSRRGMIVSGSEVPFENSFPGNSWCEKFVNSELICIDSSGCRCMTVKGGLISEGFLFSVRSSWRKWMKWLLNNLAVWIFPAFEKNREPNKV